MNSFYIVEEATGWRGHPSRFKITNGDGWFVTLSLGISREWDAIYSQELAEEVFEEFKAKGDGWLIDEIKLIMEIEKNV